MDIQEESLGPKRELMPEPDKPVNEAQENAPPAKPVIIVRVLGNRLEATLLLHPSGSGTELPLLADILDAMAGYDIVHGVNMALLEDLCAKPVYYHVFVIARGQAPMVGRDGYVDYLIHSTPSRQPVIGADGVADYKNIDFFTVVHEGQSLCEIHPAEKGEDGMDVHGSLLEGKYGRSPLNPAGANTVLGEDGRRVCAAVSGHYKMLHGMVSVVEVLRVDKNVDNSTGNIKFVGDVVVGGDVAVGFSIKCSGSLSVQGSVEGATLEAGTDITVSMGMLGMDKGMVRAGGDIRCKFIQNCVVRATGNIYAESILLSNVECGGNLELGGKRGSLIGGRTTVAGRIAAKTIGSPAYVPTEIHICPAGADKNTLIGETQTQIRSLNGEALKVLQILARFEDLSKRSGLSDAQARELRQVISHYDSLAAQRETAGAGLQQLQREQLEACQDACFVECRGTVYPSTKITFGSAVLLVGDPLSRSRIQLEEGQVVARQL